MTQLKERSIFVGFLASFSLQLTNVCQLCRARIDVALWVLIRDKRLASDKLHQDHQSLLALYNNLDDITFFFWSKKRSLLLWSGFVRQMADPSLHVWNRVIRDLNLVQEKYVMTCSIVLRLPMSYLCASHWRKKKQHSDDCWLVWYNMAWLFFTPPEF